MSSFDVGTAFVRVIPDVRGFQALLQAQVTTAVNAVSATTSLAAQTRVAGVATGQLAQASALAKTEAIQLAIAEAQVATANASVAETAGVAAVATSELVVAQASSAGATAAASKGFASAGTQAKILQGSIVGLSRITPVAVFGLGVAGSAAIAFGLALKASVSSAADFEQQLNTFQAVTGVSADELQKVRDQAIALGADTSLAAVSAGDAAVALTELAKAGISVNDALAASRGVLQLAGAAAISAGSAATIVATQLNAFKLSGTEAVRVADLLASASIAAQGEITDFAAAFQQVSSVAKQSGLNIQTTTALLTELARAGLQGADAGTSLRTTLLRFIPTTKQAQQFVHALGVEFDNNKTLGEQLPKVIEEYRNALSQLNPIQRTTVLNQIFGQDAIRAASIIFDQSTGALERNTIALDKQGVAAQLSAAKAEGLKGAFAGLQSNLETVGVEIGGLVSGPLESLVRGLSDTVTAANNAATAIGDLASTVGAIQIPVINIPIKTAFSFDVPGGNTGVKNLLVQGLAGPGLAPTVLEAELAKRFFGNKPLPQQVDIVPQNLFDNFTEAFKSGSRKAVAKASADIKKAVVGGNVDFGFQAFIDNFEASRQKQFEDTFGKAARAAPGFGDKVRQAVQDLIKLTAGSLDKALSPGDQVVGIAQSGRFQNPVLEAQLQGNLQAELAADKAVEAFLAARLKLAKDGTKAFKIILEALVQAHKETASVQAQIDQEATSAADAQKKAADDAIQKEKDRAAAQEQLRQTILDIQSQRFSNLLAAANLTPSNADNRAVLSAEQKRLQGLRDAAQKIVDDAKLSGQKLADAKLKVAKLNGDILGIKSQIANLGKSTTAAEGGSFTIQDLFQQAVNQFNTFGSNIAGRNGILSPQDARGALGASIIGKDANLTIQGAQLTQAEKQTQLLELIYGSLNPSPTVRKQTATNVAARATGAYAWWEAAAAAGYGYGVG